MAWTMIAAFRHAASLDRIAIALSALCVVHCLATPLLLVVMASVGDPIVHQVGLLLATAIGAVALGRGVRRHRRAWPAVLGTAGIATMAAALALPHGTAETIATIAGVATLATAHALNHRGCMAAHVCRR